MSAIYVDAPGSGYSVINLDFSNCPGLTGASAVPVLMPLDNTSWAGWITAPKHTDWTLAEVRLRTKQGETSTSFLEAGLWAAGYKWAILGQSQIANGISAVAQKVQYTGLPANLVVNGTSYYTFNMAPYVTVEPLGQRLGADQYKALANELNKWVDAPFELVVAAQGGTGPVDLLEDFYPNNYATGMWAQYKALIEMGGTPDYSGVLMGWHTDLTDEGGRFGATMLEGMFLGRGPYAYALPQHFFGRATFAGTTMTVTDVVRGTLQLGSTIRILYENGGRQTPLDTTITALGTGGAGTYTLSAGVAPSDPTSEVSIIGMVEQPGIDPVFTGYITAGSAATLTVTAISQGQLQIGDRIIVTGGAQGDASMYVKILGTGTGGTGTYILSKTAAGVGTAGAPVAMKAIRGPTKSIGSLMSVFGGGTPIFYMPPTRHNTTSAGGPFDYDGTVGAGYVEGVKQGGVGAARESGKKWARDRGYPIGVDAIDLALPDTYHPDDSLQGKVRFGRQIALSLAKCQGLASFGEPAARNDFAFTDGTRAKFRFSISLPNMGRLRSGDGSGNVTPCIELSRDGVTWSRSKHSAIVNPTGGGALPADMVEVTITDPAWRVAGLKARVLAGGPFAWSGADWAAANDACLNKMLYEDLPEAITGAPGICVQPSMTAYSIRDV